MAEQVAHLVETKPNASIGFPTGRTPTRMYELLVGISKDRRLDWQNTHCFALDDYLDADEQHSFQSYLESNLYAHLRIPNSNKHNPRFTDDYDRLIASCGGLDLILLGVGTNGHIAFNEPSTPKNSWTHCIWLTQSTRTHNQEFFENKSKVPEKAVTMGVSTILGAREIILMAFGEDKREIVEQAFDDVVDPKIPASFLLLHQKVSLYTDFELSAISKNLARMTTPDGLCRSNSAKQNDID